MSKSVPLPDSGRDGAPARGAGEDESESALDWLHGRINYERQAMPRPTGPSWLGRMRRLAAALGDPHLRYPALHVTGTKGKGSVSTLLAETLADTGRVVGLFTSPHLHRLGERFRVAGREPDRPELEALVREVRRAAARLPGGFEPTFFEILTAAGLRLFAERKVDIAVLEVGMGGRLDSTNIVRPLVSVITSISFDHMKSLGDTLGAIAREKAGIVKRGRPLVSGVPPESPEPRNVIRETALARRSRLVELGTDFRFAYRPPQPPLRGPTRGRVSIVLGDGPGEDYPAPGLGAHQGHNLAVARAALRVLAEERPEYRDADQPARLARVAERIAIPARLEIVPEPGVPPDRFVWLIDGAHNEASARALAEAAATHFPPGSRTLIFGSSKDKDLPAQLRALLPMADLAIATRFLGNPRAAPEDLVAEEMRTLGARRVETAPTPAEALARARSETRRPGLAVVAGSLFLAAECREALGAPGSENETNADRPR